MLSTWVVSVDIERAPRQRRRRPCIKALRRARRGVGVRVAADTGELTVRFGGVSFLVGAESSQGKRTGTAEFPGIAPRRAGTRHGNAPRTDPWAERLRRTLASLARARRLQDWIEGAPGRTAADAARMEGVTRARVCQLLSLLKLAPEIRADLERPGRTGRVLGELELRLLVPLEWPQQVARYRAILRLDEPPDELVERRLAKMKARSRGLASHLARARELQAQIETGRFASLADVARYEGISGPRASQLLNLLELHPDILAAIERGEAQHVSERQIRDLTRMAPEDQLPIWFGPNRVQSA